MTPKSTLRILVHSFQRHCIAVLCPFIFVSAAVADEHSDRLFESSIRPVLIETCLRCHGTVKASGGLRVDSRQALMTGGESGASILVGKPEESLLIKAIRRHEDVSAMPPDKEKALRPDQVAHFETWIRSGAHWPALSRKFQDPKHWSFEPINDTEPPKLKGAYSGLNAIDAFIFSKQKDAGVNPSINADKQTLIRRATFDLTGLPPTPAEVVSFLKDTSLEAYEKVIDRLLNSSHYGERWGRHWLDVVRYADTAGETADYPVSWAWRYRNYVIDAFNADKPYDQFLREQIAGDVLAELESPEKYAEHVTATGYLAISRRFGFDSENYHHLTIQDTIDTLGQSVLGLSLGCARCHDHKFDAISMKDYYGLYAIFDSSRYSFPGSEQKQKFRSMVPLIPPREAVPKWRAFEQRIASLSSKLEKAKMPAPSAILRSLNGVDGDFEMQAPAAGGSNGVLVPPWLFEGKIAVSNAAQSPYKNLHASGKVGVSIAADAGHYRISQSLYPRRTNKDCRTLHVNLDFRVAASDSKMTDVHRFWIGATLASPALKMTISSDSVSLQTVHGSERVAQFKPNEWQNLQLNINLVDGTVSGDIGTPLNHSSFSDKPLIAGWTGTLDLVAFESSNSEQVAAPAIDFDNFGVQEETIPSAFAPMDAPSLASPELDRDSLSKELMELAEYTSRLERARTIKQQLATLQTEAQQALLELNSLLTDGPCPMAYGMAEGTPHAVPIHLRGEPSQPGELVPRGFVMVLGGGSIPEDSPGSGRLELAQWLTRPDNPLTARVIVNRIWQYHFGVGLVKTPNDFGARGIPPTHPELLDYLATQFIECGWSMKAMHRLIMLSATYQQSSKIGIAPSVATTDIRTTDLFAHFLRRRLSAEEIRDSILAVCGELNLETAKAHPFPSPLQWGFTQHGPFHAVYDHNQRSVYLMTQRLKRHPYLALFDGPDPNATTADRLGTTVPTQALYFLNDGFVHASADAWAKRLRANNPSETGQIKQAYEAAFSRPATTAEQSEAAEFLNDYRNELTKLGKNDIENLALSAFLRTLLGSNEFLHVD